MRNATRVANDHSMIKRRCRFAVAGLVLTAFLAVSGCSGNCQAGGGNSGGKVLCNALKF